MVKLTMVQIADQYFKARDKHDIPGTLYYGTAAFEQQANGTFKQLLGMPRVEVTDEMIEAGVAKAKREIGLSCTDMQEKILRSTLRAAYPAMHAVAPVPLVSPAEDVLRQERDAAIAERDQLRATIAKYVTDQIAAHLIAAKATPVPADPAPHNPFREFPRSPRMGG